MFPIEGRSVQTPLHAIVNIEAAEVPVQLPGTTEAHVQVKPIGVHHQEAVLQDTLQVIEVLHIDHQVIERLHTVHQVTEVQEVTNHQEVRLHVAVVIEARAEVQEAVEVSEVRHAVAQEAQAVSAGPVLVAGHRVGALRADGVAAEGTDNFNHFV